MEIKIDTHTSKRAEERGASENGRCSVMDISYNDRADLLYIRLDDRKQEVVNRRVSENIVLDIGEKDRIIGIEILDASKYVTLDKLLPIKYEVAKMPV